MRRSFSLCSSQSSSPLRRLAAELLARLLLALGLVVLVPAMASAQCEARWRYFAPTSTAVQSRCVATHSDGLSNDIYLADYGSVFRWTSTGWLKLGADFDSFITTMVTYRGDLYVSGPFQEYNGQPLFGLARWNGTDWEAVGGGIQGQSFAAYVFEDKLYVGGNNFHVNNMDVRGLIVWDGVNWSKTDLDFTFDTNGGLVSAIGEFEGDLVIGGNFYYNGIQTVKSMLILHNGVFQPLGDGLYSPGGNVLSIVEYKGQLYASGQIYSGNGAPAGHIARFNGTSWEGLGTGLTTPGFEMVIHDDKLVVCGQFDHANGVPVQGVAAWDGTQWSSVGFDTLSANSQSICLSPTGGLLVAGQHIVDPGNGEVGEYQLARFGEGKPEYTVQPTPGTYCNNYNVLIYSSAMTDVIGGDLSFDWSKDAVPLEDGPTDHYSEILGAHSAAPLILHAHALDSGYYQAVANNECGDTLSFVAYVVICASDVNCDGISDLSDFFDFFNAWDITAPGADIDGDGQVDLTDFFAFFNAFDVQC